MSVPHGMTPPPPGPRLQPQPGPRMQPQPGSQWPPPPGTQWPRSVGTWLAPGLLGIIGGYLTSSSISTILLPIISGAGVGSDAGFVLLGILQLLFGAGMVMVACALARGGATARTAAISIFGLGMVVTVGIAAMLATATIPRIPILQMSVGNSTFVLLLVGAACWLLASGARPLAYLSLIATLLVAPLPVWMQLSGASSSATTLVVNVVAFAVALLVLGVSRKPRTFPGQHWSSPR